MDTTGSSSRVSVRDQRVLEIIEETLAPLYLRLGSVNALSEELKESLKSQGLSESAVYPTRLHGLLSMNPSKSVNAGTLDFIKKSASQINLADYIYEEDKKDKYTVIAKDLAGKWNRGKRGLDSLSSLSEEHGVPPAIAYYLLRKERVIQEGNEIDSIKDLVSSPPLIHTTREPDWSFQTDAVRKVLKDISIQEENRVALVFPTGGGKTRTALRIGMNLLLENASNDRPIIWITHRVNLKSQAYRQLQKMVVQGVEGIPHDSVKMFLGRFKFMMVSSLKDIEALRELDPIMIILDEGHHAAAPSYDNLFESERFAPVLVLTATPNRPDGKSIRVDKISYSITFRELVKRNVILMPEFLDFPVTDFDWHPVNIQSLSRHLIEKAKTDFKKVLVIAPTIEKIGIFYQGLLEALRDADDHFLTENDIGYIHSKGISGSGTTEDFLRDFEKQSRGILVSAQMLLEGYDDPSINTVVLTYPSSSIVVKLQAAGRCVRFNPDKEKAYVLQARNDSLAYYFDQKWLYEDISDFLRPVVEHVPYESLADLKSKVSGLLSKSNVHSEVKKKALSQLESLDDREEISLMLSGLPFSGPKESFEQEAKWSALLVPKSDHFNFVRVFNDYCGWGADIKTPHLYLKRLSFLGEKDDEGRASLWRQYNDLVSAMTDAKEEVYGWGSSKYDGKNRPFFDGCATTWLKYYKFYPDDSASPEEDDFFSQCFNKEAILSELSRNRDSYKVGFKIPVPLSGWEGFLLSRECADRFLTYISQLRKVLSDTDESKRYQKFYELVMTSHDPQLPARAFNKFDLFLDETFENQNMIILEENNEV